MAIKLFSCSIFLLVFALGHAFERRNLTMKPKGTVKTIENIEDGDVIDCVDYYQQPAFDNPIIRNSQVHPSYIPSGMKIRNNSRIELKQTWHKYGKCPDGSVPIRRGRNNRTFPKRQNGLPAPHEYAMAYQTGTLYGGVGSINLWNPYTEADNEFSVSKISVKAAAGTSNCNSVEAGWMVYPDKYGDSETRLFVFFTNDNYQNTNCYDLDCGNFVKLPGDIALGCTYDGSVYDGPQYDLEFNIHRDNDPKTGHWWFVINGHPVGYWVHHLFTTLSYSADEVSWGGEIMNKNENGVHTATHMGNGHFPYEGVGKASYVRNARVWDYSHKWVDATFSGERTTNSLCYDIKLQPNGTNYGTYFLYGGPGYSSQCYNPL